MVGSNKAIAGVPKSRTCEKRSENNYPFYFFGNDNTFFSKICLTTYCKEVVSRFRMEYKLLNQTEFFISHVYRETNILENRELSPDLLKETRKVVSGGILSTVERTLLT